MQCISDFGILGLWQTTIIIESYLINYKLFYLFLKYLQEGRIAIKQVANILLCLCANRSVEFGLLKEKILTLSAYLDEPLRKISGS